MTSLPYNARGFDWEGAGREVGERLGGYCALVVIGVDPVTTGRVAIGIGRAQAAHRRVAVGDLFAESPPIQELVQTDDPHGLVDSFIYGVSLTRIAYEVPGAGQLFVMPSGTEPPDYEEMFPNPRWHRLAAGFREVGALLVLAAPASAPHIENLVAATDGAILVGEAVPASLPAARVVGSVREPQPPRVSPAETPSTPPPAAPRGWARGWKRDAGHSWTEGWTRGRIAAVTGIVITLVLAAMAVWLASRPLADSDGMAIVRRPADTTRAITTVLAATPDSGAGDSTAVAALSMPPVSNPGDSANAAAFAVQLMAANTQAGAILKLQKDGKELPAATFAPATIDGSRWFLVVSGAYTDRGEADSLLNGLRRRRMLLGGESVVRLPFAFLIDSGRPASAVPAMVAAYADRGQPVYALRQENGTAWLLVGAFSSTEQASLYLESLRASGISPVLVYRKGRAF